MAWADMRDILATNFKSNPLPVEGGGTGAGSAEGALANLGVADYAIAQGKSGGWTYVKYASGTGMCWKTVNVTTDFSAWGSGYLSATGVRETYPFKWAAPPVFNATAVPYGADWSILAVCTRDSNYPDPTTDTPKVNAFRPSNASGVSVDFMLFAVGRWK